MPPPRRRLQPLRPFTSINTCSLSCLCCHQSEYITCLDETNVSSDSTAGSLSTKEEQPGFLSSDQNQKDPLSSSLVGENYVVLATNSDKGKLRRRRRRPGSNLRRFNSNTTVSYEEDLNLDYLIVNRLPDSLDTSWRNSSVGLACSDVDSDLSSSSHQSNSKYLSDGKTSFIDSFSIFRLNYLIVQVAIMLADGLQGTHLYILYEGYGYSVASLYCLGFVSGTVTSPFIGPIVDKIGRKRSAMLYCLLEMIINYLEQFPIFAGLIISRVVGGITTNLLFSVFESWLVTEHRKRGFSEDKLEIILRDSVILSNMAAILSGYLAHFLATHFGSVGPFKGAVACTGIALCLVGFMWKENYGGYSTRTGTFRGHMIGAFNTIVNDSKISRIGLVQGLTEGTLQTFVFLWSPALRNFSKNAPSNTLGLDTDGEPAYGLIFGAFMACGVSGGLASPIFRKAVTWLTSSKQKDHDDDISEIEDEGQVKPSAVELLSSGIYLISAIVLLTPYILRNSDSPHAFSLSLISFLIYEFCVGVYMPLEGVIRSIYMPNESMCSLMTMLRVIVNLAVALGVISTNYIAFSSVYFSISMMMIISSIIQFSLVSKKELGSTIRLKIE